MNKIITDFKKSLMELNEVKEYKALALEVKENSFLKNTEIKLKEYQIQMVHLLNDKKEKEYEEVKSLYLTLKKEYDSYPLYVNYLQAKERVNDLLKEISNIINNL